MQIFRDQPMLLDLDALNSLALAVALASADIGYWSLFQLSRRCTFAEMCMDSTWSRFGQVLAY